MAHFSLLPNLFLWYHSPTFGALIRGCVSCREGGPQCFQSMGNSKQIRVIDQLAGCVGLSECFIQVGCAPVAHVEIDQAACYAFKTRMAIIGRHMPKRVKFEYLSRKDF